MVCGDNGALVTVGVRGVEGWEIDAGLPKLLCLEI